MQQCDVSIIIVNYNTRELTLDCLRSVYDQTRDVSFEVIVIDNASTDGSADAIAEVFPQVRLIRLPNNVGFAAGNNHALRIAAGRYVCLVNSDVVLQPACLDRMKSFLDNNATVGVVGPRLLWSDLTLQLSCRRLPGLWNTLCPALGLTRLFPRTRWFCSEHMSDFGHDMMLDVEALVGAVLMVRRAAMEQVGMLDESFFIYCEEIDWCKRFRGQGWRIMFLPQAEAIHLGGASSDQDLGRFACELVRSNHKYWRKHHGRFGQYFYGVVTVSRQISRIVVTAIRYAVIPAKREQLSRDLRTRWNLITTCLACAHEL